MITCPACGKENEASAHECRRCRAPLRDEPAAHADQFAGAAPVGDVCRRCEAFNEPGVTVCSNCGLALTGSEPVPAADVAMDDRTPPQAFSIEEQPEPEATLSQELRALAISDEEAAEAGLSMDKTPAEPFSIAPPGPPAKVIPADKPCASCGARNPLAAKFCFDCGTPFAKKAAPAVEPPPPTALPRPPVNPEPPPSIHVDEDLVLQTEDALPPEAEPEEMRTTAEGDPLPLSYLSDEPGAEPEEAPVELRDELPEEAAQAPVEPEPIEEAQPEPAPFPASLVAEKGGASFSLPHLENVIGGAGAQVELADDPFVAPRMATLAFAGDQLVLRDEGSANGVYLKVRESAPIARGDSFIAGERLFRFDGPADLPRNGAGETPLLGAPRPQRGCVRVSELLAGGRTGRTCYRGGPVIAIGRAGCDMNFPSDTLLAARHTEIRLGDDGAATLVDLGQATSGVLLRVRETAELQPGDVVQVGDQQLRLEVG